MRLHTNKLRQGLIVTTLALSLVALVGCGSESSSTPDGFGDLSLYYNELGELSPSEQLVVSDQYQGKLIVYLDEGLGARVSTEKGLFTEESSQEVKLQNLQKTLTEFPSVTLKPSTSLDPEALDKRRAELEKISGKPHRDWNSVVHLEITDPVTAVKLMRELQELDVVKMVDPRIKPQMFANTFSLEATSEVEKSISVEKGDDDVVQTPDLSAAQQYLSREDITGGINAIAAWQQGILGADTWLIQAEDGINSAHEDLPFQGNRRQIWGAICTEDEVDQGCGGPTAVAHGTAMAGIMAGLHNDIGVNGIAPDTTYRITDPLTLQGLTDGLEDQRHNEIPPGSVFVVIVGAGCPSAPEIGCLPVTVIRDFYDMAEDAAALGVTVVVGAGNGAKDLDNLNSYYPNHINIGQSPGNSIVVGAADTAHNVIADSTYGSPVELFAWGRNVASAAYPSLPNWDWFLEMQPAPINDRPDRYYANFISGTSPATAIIGGAAALVQSHAKQLLAEPVLNSDLPYENSRYLRPEKLKQLLYDSGVAQRDNTGHSIGRQPRLDVALFGGRNQAGQQVEGVDQYVARIFQQFPELNDQHGPIAQDRMDALREAGVGIVCQTATPEKSDMLCDYDSRCVLSTPERSDPDCPLQYRCVPGDPVRSDPDCDFDARCIVSDPENSDPDCPENFIWPEGREIAKTLDFDGDGRADLVDWNNGNFKLDLSSVGEGELGFGDWDVDIHYPAIAGSVVWPYVEDMNSDGRTDLVLYDKMNGRWYIRYTTTNLLDGGAFGNWSRVVNHSATWRDTLAMDPRNSRYSRPHPGDYNDDGWIDIAIACSDGFWRIDFGGPGGAWDGQWDQQVRYLSAQRLADAPGWAYQTYWDGYAINYKIPDTLPEAGRIVGYEAPEFDTSIDVWTYNFDNPNQPFPALYDFGGNDTIVMLGRNPPPLLSMGIKHSDGTWPVSQSCPDLDNCTLAVLQPDGVFGGAECRPAQANFYLLQLDRNGRPYRDQLDDRAVMCSDGWKIASAVTRELIEIPLEYDPNEFHLPGRSYAGGISYADVLDAIELQQDLNPNSPPFIPIDMAVPGVGN